MIKIERLIQHPWSLVLGFLTYLPFLGWMSIPLTGDQKVYLNIALEMRESGNWLIPLMGGEPAYFKPPLQYWATLLGWKGFGFNLFGALLPSTVAALLTGWSLTEISFLINRRRSYAYAGLWFLATIGAATYGVTAQMEIWLCAFMSLGWWAALKYLSTEFDQRRPIWLYLAFIFCGLLCLVKSPLYSVLWGLGFVTYLLVTGEWETFRLKSFYGALAAGIAVGISWFLAILFIDGDRFWAQYVVRESLQKTSGNGTSAFGIWGALLYLSFPATLLLIPAVRSFVRNRRPEKIIPFFLCWVVPSGVFFTLFPYRVTTYLFVLVPVISLLGDFGYFRERKSILFRWCMLLMGFSLFFLLELVSILLNQEHLVPDWIVLGLGLTGGLAILSAIKDWYRGMLGSSILAVFFFHGAIAHFSSEDLVGLRSAIHKANPKSIYYLDRNESIWHEYGLLSVAVGKRIKKVADLDTAVQHIQSGEMVILPDETPFDPNEIQAKLLGLGEKRELVMESWMRWKRRVKLQLREVLFSPGAITTRDVLRREFRVLYLQR